MMNMSIIEGLLNMLRTEILHWLRESNPHRLNDFWRLADRVRQDHVGGEVHLRGLVEISNHCVRLCGYCGLRAGNLGLRRYRMSDDEITACVEKPSPWATAPSCCKRAKTRGWIVEGSGSCCGE